MDTRNKSGLGVLLALAALAVLLIFFKHLWLWLLIALGVVIAAGAALLFALDRHYRKKAAAQSSSSPAGQAASPPPKYDYPNVLRQYYNIRDPQMRQFLRDVDEGRKKMIRTVEEDPRDRPAADRFMRTALGGAARIAEGFARLEKAPAGSHEAEAARERARDSMRSIAQAFAQQNNRLYENDILHLEVETEVLDKSLKAQGYQTEPSQTGAPTGKESNHE